KAMSVPTAPASSSTLQSATSPGLACTRKDHDMRRHILFQLVALAGCGTPAAPIAGVRDDLAATSTDSGGAMTDLAATPPTLPGQPDLLALLDMAVPADLAKGRYPAGPNGSMV